MHLPTLFRRLVVIGTPLVLGTLEIFHPMPGENFIADLHHTWAGGSPCTCCSCRCSA